MKDELAQALVLTLASLPPLAVWLTMFALSTRDVDFKPGYAAFYSSLRFVALALWLGALARLVTA